MAVSTPNRIKVNQYIILLTGLVILTASLLIYLLILKNVYGSYAIADILPTSENFIRAGARIEVAILDSKYTEHILPEGSTWLSDNISTWKIFLRSSNVKYDIITDQDIELGKHKKYQLLVLPGSKSLSDREVVQIKSYIENGGSVFATSGTASYSDDGRWRGWDFFSEVFGLGFTGEITADEFTKIHTLRGGLPLTAGIPTGFPLKVATWDRPMACEVLEPRTVQVSFWYNFRKELSLAREEINKTAGIAYGHYGKGRYVWLGFELNSVIGKQEDYIFFDRFFRNSFNWLTYAPTALVQDWPEQYRSAAVIMPALTENIENVRNLFGIAKSEGVLMTFLVDQHYADLNSQLLRNMAQYGEIAAVADVGYMASVTDTINKLNSYKQQYGTFNYSRKKLEKASASTVRGAIPLYGLYDENSLRALIKSGYQFVITDSLTDRSVPNAIIRGDQKIVSFTKTARDDYEIIRHYGLTDPGFQQYTYEEDVDRLSYEGGLYIMKIHTDYQCQPQYVDVVRNVIKYLKQKKYWIATATEIRDWWIARSQLEVSCEVRSSKRMAVEISNPGKDAVKDIVVQININKNIRSLQITSDIFGTPRPQYSYDKEKQILYLKIKSIDGKDSYSYFIDYDNESV